MVSQTLNIRSAVKYKCIFEQVFGNKNKQTNIFFNWKILIHKNESYKEEQSMTACVWKSCLMCEGVYKETSRSSQNVFGEGRMENERDVFPLHEIQEPKFW